ncbi:hypothetical protein CDD81_5281 [Ophiocordyceps australis]|uniref:Uncharacterized protein n=1 Tax=Ophiocordyceps australis TaxID=1399860 RepID=A0A2C5XC65_9HYPO|nr:hypothetical protein CDD81_5281 [Ophiocordyceps australis]
MVPRRDEYDLAAAARHATRLSATSQLASPRTLKHESRRIGGAGPDLPPTPPTYSRNSSGSHAASTASMTPACASAALLSTPSGVSDGPRRILTTPPHQQSPLTPDVTPPSPARLSRIPRFSASERRGSRLTATDALPAARQDAAALSDKEGAGSSARPALDSTTLSQFTNRSTTDSKTSRLVHARALSLALKQLHVAAADSQANRRSVKFDGDWGTPSDIEREWDDNLERFVSVRMRRTCPGLDTAAAPMHHYKLPRRAMLPLAHDAANTADAPWPLTQLQGANQMPAASFSGTMSATTPESTIRRQNSAKCSTTDTAVGVHGSSASSPCAKPTPSAVVEAMVVEAPRQKRQHLRHVSKKSILRDSSPAKRPLAQDDARPRKHVSAIPVANKTRAAHHETRHKGPTQNSPICSAQTRRQVWNNGGLPVAVVPGRLSSSQAPPAREPSLRSTSSRPSKRGNSISSSPADPKAGKAPASRRGPATTPHRKSASESSPCNFLALMNCPPAIPPRTSSLSAPTSCNASRTVSLTANSLKALERGQQSPPRTPTQAKRTSRIEPLAAKPVPQALKQAQVQTPTCDAFQNATTAATSPTVSRHEDGHSFKRQTSGNTPFSVTSLDTLLTAQEVSEALAIHMVSHRNSSVLMVNNATRPLEALQTPSWQPTNVPEAEHLMAWSQERQPMDSQESAQSGNSLETAQPSSLLETAQPTNTWTTRQSRAWLETRRPYNVPATRVSTNMANPTTRKPLPTKTTVQSPRQAGLANDRYISPLSRNPPGLAQIAELPPAINLIPATPSGVTPAEEKMAHLGNYHEATGQQSRRPSLVRRTFSRRSQSTGYAPLDARRPSFLAKSFSFSLHPRQAKPAGGFPQPREHHVPAEQERLHPFWRPWYTEMQDECAECAMEHDDCMCHEAFAYSLVDQPSLKTKLRRTFAVLPDRRRHEHIVCAAHVPHGLERRTIGRTPSGHLRVMQQSTSCESLRPQTCSFIPSCYVPANASLWRRLWRKRNMRRFSLGANGFSRIIHQHRFRPDLMPGTRDASAHAHEPASIRYARRDAPMLA